MDLSPASAPLRGAPPPLPVRDDPAARLEAVDRLHSATAIYTTESVVDVLLDRLGWPRPRGRLIDPSCGDGAFLVRALARLPLAVDDVDAAVRAVHGWELHAGAVGDARVRVATHLEGRGWSAEAAARTASRAVREADFLTDPIEAGAFDVIAGNPPYLRFGHLPELFKRLYARNVPEHARGDLQHAFLARCWAILAGDGAIGFVTADRWLLNETAGELRERLGERVGIGFLGRLDASTSFYRPKDRRRGSPPRIHPVEIVLSRAAAGTRPLGREAVSPDGDPEFRADAAGPVLGDVAEVRIAPWLGSAGVFVVEGDVAAGLPAEDLVPAVDTDDIDPRTDALREPRRRAILTRRDVEPTGAVRRHLLAATRGLPPRARRRSAWWMPPEPVTLRLDRPSLLVPRIARRLRAIPLAPGLLPINHNLSVVAASTGPGLDEIRALLLSDASQEWIARNAPRLENGFLSISTRLLRRLPVPSR